MLFADLTLTLGEQVLSVVVVVLSLFVAWVIGGVMATETPKDKIESK